MRAINRFASIPQLMELVRLTPALRETRQRLGARLKQVAQPIRRQPRVPQDSRQRSLSDLLVERHHQRVSAPLFLQPHMAAALADDLPAVSLERPNQGLAGYDRLSGAHAGSGNLRRITPL